MFCVSWHNLNAKLLVFTTDSGNVTEDQNVQKGHESFTFLYV